MALPINIDDLINSRTVESVRIEFKKGWNPEKVMHSTCAFANDIKEYGGGYIIIGIEEKDGSPILPPHGVEQNQIDSIQKKFYELCRKIQPNIFPTIEPIEFQGKHIVIIWITTGEERPYDAPIALKKDKVQRRIYVRPASLTVLASREQEKELRELATHRHFDDRINTKASLSDLDLGLMLSYLQEVKSSLYNEATNIPLEDLCLNMQIARGPKENIKPLNVGLLLFSKNPEKYFEGCVTNLIEFEDDSGIDYIDKQFKGPVHIQIRMIMEYLDVNIIKQFTSKSNGSLEANTFFNYPYQALEESVVNALYHRSYQNPNPTEIRIYKSKGINENDLEDKRRIEIISFPGPLPPIDEEALSQLKVSARTYRNIKLGDWLKNLKLAEKYATGIPTITKSLADNGSPKLILSTDKDKSHFLTVIKIHEDTPDERISSKSEIERIRLNNFQQTILDALIDNPQEYADLKEILTSEELSSEIEFLKSKELIKEKNNLIFVTQKGMQALKDSF